MTITFEDFDKMDIRIGEVISAEKVENSNKLIKMNIDIGNETRQIVAGIAEYYEPVQLIGRKVPVLVNLEPKSFMGIESKGMILCTDINDEPVLLFSEKDVPVGSKIR